jgi:hypothetical protein
VVCLQSSHLKKGLFILNMKKCTDCKKSNNFKEFYKSNNTKDGFRGICKKCWKDRSYKYNITKNGLINNMYSRQKYNSKNRDHKPPNYTKIEFTKWLLGLDKFQQLYEKWINSGYKTELIPSIDRIDDYKGYSFENIQIMTWKENYNKYKNNPIGRFPVLKLKLNGEVVKKYRTITEASNDNNMCISSISRRINGITKNKDFIWKYDMIKGSRNENG